MHFLRHFQNSDKLFTTRLENKKSLNFYVAHQFYCFLLTCTIVFLPKCIFCVHETVEFEIKSSTVWLRKMSSFDPSTHTRHYTVGVSIAVLLIFLIAIFHLWKFVFKRVKRWLNPTQLEVVITEIALPEHGDRKLSTNCIQKLEMFINYDDDLPRNSNLNPQRAKRRSLSESSGRKILERKKSIKRKRNSIVQCNCSQSIIQPSTTMGVTFLAGYSHRHVDEG